MKELEVGDVVRFDMSNSQNDDVERKFIACEPFVITPDSEYKESYLVKRLNGLPFDNGFQVLHWLKYRFRKDEFLTAARKACADAQ